jgi:predicted nucleic acid-binding protein
MKMTTNAGYLLDSSVLIALAVDSHIFHETCLKWITAGEWCFLTCPITQGALIRAAPKVSSQLTVLDGQELVRVLSANPRHRFLPDDLPYSSISMRGLQGSGQVTDAYLAELARHHGVGLATFDRAQAALNPDIAHLLT